MMLSDWGWMGFNYFQTTETLTHFVSISLPRTTNAVVLETLAAEENMIGEALHKLKLPKTLHTLNFWTLGHQDARTESVVW